MSHVWKQNIHINETIAAELIEKQQHFKVHIISFLDEGWDNVVYLVNETLIFRFPRRESAVFCMENEIALTPYIQKQVSFPLSASKWIGKPTKQYPYVYSGYRILPGKPLCEMRNTLIDDERFAIILATWLKELHAIPVTSEYMATIKGNHAWKTDINYRIKRCHENITQYAHYFAEAHFKKETLLAIINRLSQWYFDIEKNAFIHGDLYSRHIMVNLDTGLPSGLIDWGDVHIGHPGIDLLSGMIFTKKAFQVFLKIYGHIDEKTYQIMLMNAFCHSMSFLPYAFEENKISSKRWAIMMLQRVIEEINYKDLFPVH